MHIADYSAFHFRQMLLLRSCQFVFDQQIPQATVRILHGKLGVELPPTVSLSEEEVQAILVGWRREGVFVDRLICLYPGHESCWCHKRFVALTCHTLIMLVDQCMKGKSNIENAEHETVERYVEHIASSSFDDVMADVSAGAIKYNTSREWEEAFVAWICNAKGSIHEEQQQALALAFQKWMKREPPSRVL